MNNYLPPDTGVPHYNPSQTDGQSLDQARREGGVRGLATPGSATFGGPSRRPEICIVRQNVPF